MVATALALTSAWAVFRRWHVRWGTTDEERRAVLPGDDVDISRFGMRATRAITIAAPPEDVWPWIAQLGLGKAGWYSYDLLDNLGRPSATEVLAQWQEIAVGDPAAPMSPFTPLEDSPWRVAENVVNRHLLWRNGNVATWAWVLTPTHDGGTRLTSRIRMSYASWSGLAFAPVMEIADFAMYRRMLLGIKERAERLARSEPDLEA